MARRPSPRDLIDRLMEVYGSTTVEDLSRRSGLPLRALTRYRAGGGIKYDRAIELLDHAGWLKIDDDDATPPGGPAYWERTRELAVRLADDAEELAELLASERAVNE